MNTNKLVNKTQHSNYSIETTITDVTISIFDSKAGNRMCMVTLPGAEFWASTSPTAPVTDRERPYHATRIKCRANSLRQGNLQLGTLLEIWEGQDCVYRDPEYQAEQDAEKTGLGSKKVA